MIVVHDPACERYGNSNHPEKAARITITTQLLKAQKMFPIEWTLPRTVDERTLFRAHSQEYIEKLKKGEGFDDSETPFFPDMYLHATRSVGAALEAMSLALAGKPAFSLMRPPGHHAEREKAMGFCYLNIPAICALEALATSSMKVAVFDFDVHHGNGTEAILKDNPDALYVSIHQVPGFPGTGTTSSANVWNYPIMPETPPDVYLSYCNMALKRISGWHPDLLIVSAGFDAYKSDPLSEQLLHAKDFKEIGRMISDLGIPHFSILEGGYSVDLAACVISYMIGLEKGKQPNGNERATRTRNP